MYKKIFSVLKNFYEFCDMINEIAAAQKYWLSDFDFKPRFLCCAYDLSRSSLERRIQRTR